ncbi:MAG: hypothetical protein R3250_04865 [Melioribacteraceae bacterium]|nr:hypothetical protein [Melioribacteraceae bacterium]
MFFLQMSGFPGSGKSTLAKQIAKLTSCIEWIPFVGTIMHMLSALSIMIDAAKTSLEGEVTDFAANIIWNVLTLRQDVLGFYCILGCLFLFRKAPFICHKHIAY